MTDDEHDPDDALFRRALDRAAGPAPDVAAGWASLAARSPGLRRPDRRVPRLVVLATSAATLALVLAVARPATDRGPAAGAPAPAVGTAGSTAAATSSSATSSSATSSGATAAGAVRATGVPATTAPVAAAPSGATPASVASVPATVGGADGTTVPPTSGASSSAPSPGGTAGTGAPTSGPAASAAAPSPSSGAGPSPVSTGASGARHTATVAGGTITAAVDGDRLVDPVVTPAAGWTAEVLERRDDRIEVRFRSTDRTITVRVRPDGDGLRIDDRS